MQKKGFDPSQHYWRKARQLLKLSAAQAAECSVMPFFADWQQFRSRVEWQALGGTRGFLARLYKTGHALHDIANRSSPMLGMAAGMTSHIGPIARQRRAAEDYEIHWGHYYWPVSMTSVAHMPWRVVTPET